jgi:hypothetical protein
LQCCLLMWHLELHTRTLFFCYKDTLFWHAVTVTRMSLKLLISFCLERMHNSSWGNVSTVTSCQNMTSSFQGSLDRTLQRTHFGRGYRTVMRQTYVRMMMMTTTLAAMTTMIEALICLLPFFFHICLFIHKKHILTHHLTSAGHTFSTQQYTCIPLHRHSQWVKEDCQGHKPFTSTLHVFNLSISKAFLIFTLCVHCLQIIVKLSLSVIPNSISLGKKVTEISIFGAFPNAESW